MKDKSFEEILKQLEQVVQDLESKDIKLEDAVKKYQEGLELSKLCHEKLTVAHELIVKEISD